MGYVTTILLFYENSVLKSLLRAFLPLYKMLLQSYEQDIKTKFYQGALTTIFFG